MITLTWKQLLYSVQKAAQITHEMPEYGYINFKSLKDRNPNDIDLNKDSKILINPSCSIDLIGGVTFGDYVMIARGVMLLTHDHPMKGRDIKLLRAEEPGWVIPCPKVIEDDVWIYTATVLPKCSYIAKGVVIGIGSMVTKSIEEEYSIWAGNPARRVGSRLENKEIS